jgi:hypothetical protein
MTTLVMKAEIVSGILQTAVLGKVVQLCPS